MSYGKHRRSGGSEAGSDGPVQLRRIAPGKRSLTAGLSAGAKEPGGDREAGRRQEEAFIRGSLAGTDGSSNRSLALRRSDDGPATSPSDANEIASAGVAGADQLLPHGETIQRSFGTHSVSGIRAHVGGEAADAADQLGAEAFATGNDVAFRETPSLHTAAHEAAHVIQQRGGVELKGGLGPADHAAEAHADAVADRVVAGESAQELLDAAPRLGTVALKKGKGEKADETKKAGDDSGEADADAATDSTSDKAAAEDKVTVTVKWGGAFGADLSARVVLAARNKKKGDWTTLETKDVVDPDGAEGDKSQRVEETFEVVRYKFYRATITPVDDVKSDAQDVGRYRKTQLTSTAVGQDDAEVTLKDMLDVNRWNKENVVHRHEEKKLDAAKAKNVASYPLFGRTVQVNKLLEARVQDTNRRYEEGTTPEEKAEIAQSIFVMGGYAYRTQTGKKGSFSDHSIGTAIDVNYNEGKMQNALMEDKNERSVLNELVQPVVRTDPSHETFAIWKAKGQEQLEASRVFNERFPHFLANLMDRTESATKLDAAADAAAKATAARELFDSLTPSDLEGAAEKQKDATKQKQLRLIAKNWDALKAWLFGAQVVDAHAGQKDPKTGKKLPKENKTAVGMIPLSSKVLEIFLAAGWDWGGNWGGGDRKDYMHFQDESIMKQLEVEQGDEKNKP